MTIAFVMAAVLSAPPLEATFPASPKVRLRSATSDQAANVGPAPAREPHELRHDVRSVLQRTVPWMKSDPGRAAAALLPMFAALKCDTSLVKEERDRYAGIVRERLLKLERTLSKQASSSMVGSQGAAGRPTAINAAGAGGAANADYGRELVALIQHVIAPETWDVAGGNGVIMYYQPLHVLVIRQTDDVHGQVGGVFDQLRRN
jgi:hypothetical protein